MTRRQGKDEDLSMMESTKHKEYEASRLTLVPASTVPASTVAESTKLSRTLLSPPIDFLILFATSQPSSVMAYLRSGLPLSKTKSLSNNVLIEFQAVKNLVGSLGAVREESQCGWANSMTSALLRLFDESSGKVERARRMA